MFQIEFDAKEIEEALPDYRYINRLGSGSFATVHLVAHRQTNQQQALKKVSCFGMGEYQKAGAANQVRILSSLDHRNIIKVHKSVFDNNEDVIYIFMEYANSGDLSHLIEDAREKKQVVPETTVWKALSDISDALAYLHRNSIIHRDLKPANIFRKGNRFMVGDMNVAKIVKAGALAVTKTGSPLYTAPEVWESESYNQKCDVWSLGVLVYELCCLKVPFEANSIDEMVRKVKYQKSKSLPTVYSYTLDELVKRMLDVNPSNRISAQEISKIASQKMKLQTEGQNEEYVDLMMETIVFPETQKRWINLISLPPKTQRSGSRPKSMTKNRRSVSRDRSQENNSIKNESQIILNPPPTCKPTVKIPRDKSRKQRQEKKNIFEPTKLPSILRSGSRDSQRKRPASRSGQMKRQNSSSSRVSRTRRVSGEYIIRAAKKLVSDETADN